MTEEISSAPAKIPDLRAIARSSAFQFKGKNLHRRPAHRSRIFHTSLRDIFQSKAAGTTVQPASSLIRMPPDTVHQLEAYLMAHRDRELCDLCIANDIGLPVPAVAGAATRLNHRIGKIVRYSARCAGCQKFKHVTVAV
jgi:hypothetical protein